MEIRDTKKPSFYQETGFLNPRYSPRYRTDEPQILRLLSSEIAKEERSSLQTRNSLLFGPETAYLVTHTPPTDTRH